MTHETLLVARPRWLGVARAAWVVVAAAELIVFVASVRAYWLQLNTMCADPSRKTCNFTQLTPVMHDALERMGVAIGAYAGYTLAIHVAASLALLAVGVLVFWRGSDGWYGLFVSLLLITFGAIGPSAVLGSAFDWAHPEFAAAFDALTWLVFPGLGLFLVTFPDGRFVPRWSSIIVLLWTVQAVFWDTIDALPAPFFAAELLLVWGSTLAVQVYRYRRVSDASQRQQTKWVLFGFALGVSTIIVEVLLTVVFPGFGERGSASQLLEGTWVALLFTPIPLSIGIAVLKYRLWDIDPIINRTLVYGALTVSVVAIYVLIVGYLGAVFRTGGNLPISLVATGIVAVLFTPLRDRLQRAADRLMYGERDDPYKVLSRLGERLEAAPSSAPNTALSTVVETIAGALKLPYAAITLPRDGGFTTAAEHGTLRGESITLPLTHQGEPTGRLVLAPRAPGEAFSALDEKLLEDLARQAGAAVRGARLAADLQRSRERLVTAREEERRRLRRDLHDGLGAQLAGLNVQTGALRRLISRDPEGADELVVELRDELRAAIADIRRLVYDLRPPALDDLGLVGALRQLAERYGSEGGQPRVLVEAPADLPHLPAAVEVAVYRVAQEALTNVVRHARAKTCMVRLAVKEDVALEIVDDGVGIPAERTAGVGLYSMYERAAELGGSCVIEAAPEGGTRVLVRLPLPNE